MAVSEWALWVGGGVGSVALGILGNLLTPAVRASGSGAIRHGLGALHHLRAVRLAARVVLAETLLHRPRIFYAQAAGFGLFFLFTAIVQAQSFVIFAIISMQKDPVGAAGAVMYAAFGMILGTVGGTYCMLSMSRLYGVLRDPELERLEAMNRGTNIPRFDQYLALARADAGLTDQA